MNKFIKNQQLYSGILLFGLNMLASFLNYVCQIVLARILSVEAFGMMNAVFVFLMIVGVPGTSLTMYVTQYLARTDNQTERSKFIYNFFYQIILFSGLILAIGMVGIKPISYFLKIDSVFISVLVILAGGLSFFHPFFSGIFNGSKRFVLLGIYALLIPFFKLIGIWSGEALFSNDNGKIVSILLIMSIGNIIALILGYVYIRFAIGKRQKTGIEKMDFSGWKSTKDILIINLCLMLYMNIDVLSIRYRGSESVSGLYSSAVLFGRFAYYFAVTIGSILLPSASEESTRYDKKVKFLNKAMVIMGIFSLLVLLPANIWGQDILILIYGYQYAGASAYMKYVSIIAVALSYHTIFANFLIGIEKSIFLKKILSGSTLLILAGIMIFSNIELILGWICFVGVISCLTIYVFILFNQRRQNDESLVD